VKFIQLTAVPGLCALRSLRVGDWDSEIEHMETPYFYSDLSFYGKETAPVS
jgi:hypothetical protein